MHSAPKTGCFSEADGMIDRYIHFSATPVEGRGGAAYAAPPLIYPCTHRVLFLQCPHNLGRSIVSQMISAVLVHRAVHFRPAVAERPPAAAQLADLVQIKRMRQDAGAFTVRIFDQPAGLVRDEG